MDHKRLRTAVTADDLDPKDREMLGKLFDKVIKQNEKKIGDSVEDSLMAIMHGDPHMEMLEKTILEEGFADNKDDAYDLLLELADLWVPEVSRIIRKTVDSF